MSSTSNYQETKWIADFHYETAPILYSVVGAVKLFQVPTFLLRKYGGLFTPEGFGVVMPSNEIYKDPAAKPDSVLSAVELVCTLPYYMHKIDVFVQNKLVDDEDGTFAKVAKGVGSYVLLIGLGLAFLKFKSRLGRTGDDILNGIINIGKLGGYLIGDLIVFDDNHSFKRKEFGGAYDWYFGLAIGDTIGNLTDFQCLDKVWQKEPYSFNIFIALRCLTKFSRGILTFVMLGKGYWARKKSYRDLLEKQNAQ